MKLHVVREFATKLLLEGELSMKLGKEINWALDQLDQAVQSNNAKDQQIADLQKQLADASQAPTQDQEDKDAIARLDTTFGQNNPVGGAAGTDTVPAGPAPVTGTTNISVG